MRPYPSGREAEHQRVQRWCICTGLRAKLQKHNYQFERGMVVKEHLDAGPHVEGSRCMVVYGAA